MTKEDFFLDVVNADRRGLSVMNKLTEYISHRKALSEHKKQSLMNM